MDIKAVITDLDGTLCENRDIHPKDGKAVERVLEMGIPVIPATTRMRFSSSLILEDLEIDRYPLICNNGARIIGPGWKDDGSYEDWYEAFLDPKVAKKLASYTDEKNYEITTIFKEKKFWDIRKGERHQKTYPIIELVDKNEKALEDGSPISFMMHLEKNGIEGLEDFESYASRFSKMVRLDRHHRDGKLAALTVYSKQVSKKNALAVVCDRMDISIEEVLAIGDDEVDLEMLRSAGQGIAMGNSPDHVKEVADEVAPACREQGVSWALKRYVF